MKLLTVIAEKKNINETEIRINSRTDCNHIRNVFRLKEGNRLRAVDGEFEYITEILKMEKNEIILKILTKNEDNYSLNINIDAAIGILKNDKMNFVIQKLTEIGINKIIPVKTERVVVKLESGKQKWDVIVKESVKQCKAVKFTQIAPVTRLQSINYEFYDKIIYAYESSEKILKIKNLSEERHKNILYIIGPEGGFTENEVNFLRNIGGLEISLGKRILRAETAAIVLGGILSNVYE